MSRAAREGAGRRVTTPDGPADALSTHEDRTPTSRGRHSRRKGQRGELAAREPLRALTGQEWKRSNQDTPWGDRGIPDLVPVDDSIPPVHAEVKVGKAPPVLPALYQALENVRGHAVPLALVKRDRGPWVLAVRVEDFWALVEACGGRRP